MEPQSPHHEQRIGTGKISLDNQLEQRFSNLTQWPSTHGVRFQCEGQMRSPGVHSTAELVYEPQPPTQQQTTTSPGQRIDFMFTRFPWRDMSYLTGILFAIGSAFFIVNGFFLVLPLTHPDTVFASQPLWTGSTAVIGGVIFMLGGFAAMLEALNLNAGGHGNVIDGVNIDDDAWEIKNDDLESLRQNNKLVAPWRDSNMDLPLRQTYPSSKPPSVSPLAANSTASATATSTAALPALYGSSNFILWPNTPALRNIFLHDLCFIAAIIQSIGTFIFMFAIITAFPSVLDLTSTALLYILNLFPATLGGVLFITASVLQTLTTQQKWYLPNPTSVEWHVGFWNVVGSIGFMLAGALFFLGTDGGTLQGSLASLWGSCAFMVGGILQWYVAMGNCR